MEFVNNTTIKLFTEQGERILTKLVKKPAAYEGFEKTAKNTGKDIVQISQIGRRTKLKSYDITKILEMRKSGFSQEEVSKKLGVDRSTLQRFIRVHSLEAKRSRIGILPAIKRYFSAGSQKGKEEAFSVIDKFIKKIADKIAANEGLSYEDCLQDLRLSFLELEKTGAKEKINPRNLIRRLLYKLKVETEKTKLIKFERLDDLTEEIASQDFGIARFEANDLRDFLLETEKMSKFGEAGSFRTSRLHAMIIEYIKEEKTVTEIANHYALTKERTQLLLNRAMKILGGKRDIAIKGENYQHKIDTYKKLVDIIDNKI